MKDKAVDPHRLAVAHLADSAGQLSGTLAARELLRLTADAPLQPDTTATWTVTGAMRRAAGSADQPWLHLRASASVVLVCQRCLQPMVQALEADRWIRFVASEAEAERLDEESEDDVLALPARGLVDVIDLLEDELILGLPIVPRHGSCPQPLRPPSDAEPAAVHPFQALAALKRAPGSGQGD